MVQNQTKFRCREDRKIGKKFNDCAELKKITISMFYSNCLIYSSRFCKSFKFRYCPFCLIEKKKKLESTLQVCCLFYFLLLSTFFKGKVKSGFHCFFFKKKTGALKKLFLGYFYKNPDKHAFNLKKATTFSMKGLTALHDST